MLSNEIFFILQETEIKLQSRIILECSFSRLSKNKIC